MDKFLGLLGLSKKGGFIAAGDEAAREAAERGAARLLLLAEDAADNTRRRALRIAEEKPGLFVLTAPATKASLGAALGRRMCAVCAVTDVGLAAALCEKLAEGEPEKGPAAAAGERLALAKKRQAERRRRSERSKNGAAENTAGEQGTKGKTNKRRRAPAGKNAKKQTEQGKERGGLE